MKITSPRICLFEPRIPQNTGNIARSCAAYNLELDLIKPLGFSLEDKYLKRAGLDYWKYVKVNVFEGFTEYKSHFTSSRLLAFSKSANESMSTFVFNKNDILVFGREDNGLPLSIRNQCNNILYIPMPGGVKNITEGGVRSLNLSVACGIAIYKACEQQHYF